MKYSTNLKSTQTLYQIKGDCSFEKLCSLPFTEFNCDWYGNNLNFKYTFCLAANPEHLYYACRSDAPFQLKPESKAGQFIEGLWEYSACELFFSSSTTGKYYEINLAPNAAWWYCELDNYRQRSTAQSTLSKDKVSTYQYQEGSFWTTAIRFPHIVSDLKNLRLNVCAILGEQAQYFLASQSFPIVEPDFHNQELFCKVAVVAYD